MAGAAERRSNRRRDIVVIGASAGGVDALVRVVGGLPASFDAAVFVVLHLREGATSALPQILDRAGALPARQASESQSVETATITIAPPDHHLVLEAGRVLAMGGAKLNGHRPAIDILFQSAARAYGPRVVGVVLSGALDDGTVGLRAIKRRRGVAIVQADATHKGMPTSAMENVDVDAILPVHEIPAALTMFLETNGADVNGEEPNPEFDLGAGHSDPLRSVRSDSMLDRKRAGAG